MTGRIIVGVSLLILLVACNDTSREPSAAPAAAVVPYYVSQGNGEPVVLVHGFSQTHAIWFETHVYEDLVTDHRLIAVDLRGHGQSEKPHDPSAYGPNLESDLVGLLDHLNIDKAHFVGFSMGASVVGGLLVNHPNRVQTATMASGWFTTWNEDEEAFAKQTEERGKTPDRYPWEPWDQDFAALAAVLRGARHATVSPSQVASITTPAMIVFGSLEVDHMAEFQTDRLRDLPASIESRIIEGADHDSADAAVLTDEFAAAVRELITSNPVR